MLSCSRPWSSRVGIAPTANADAAPASALPEPGGRPIWCLGASGAGKTTALERILGLREFDDGTLAEPSAQPASYLPQEPPLLAATARENVRFGRELPDEDVDGLLRRLGLEQFATGGSRATEIIATDESGLSVGERRRVALARALADAEDRLVVLDEPTAGMDTQTAAKVWQLIEEQARGRTILVATHDPRAPVRAHDATLGLAGR